ncbi:MAG: molecular chaperone DnaK [Anaerolineaceae bacterium]|nr:molecular chaperone DnaK [Anaerolineaceae bacterium]
MGKIIGIDLGTTNSVVAVMEAGDPVVISTAEGSRLCPSIVAFNKNGERLVGLPAKRQAVVNPENTISSIKRLMGLHYDEVNTEQEMLPYQITRGIAGDARVNIPITNKEYTPQEISAMILAKLKKDAETYLGESVTDAVITVPAYFNDSQRQATKDAGKIAGLNVLRIINEPTASALAYGLDKKSNEKILVFDLGGGTFDVSILEVGDGVFEVKSTNGDTHLGGDDWDEVIINWAAEEFQREYNIDLLKDRQALQRLREAAEYAKIELSSVLETEINLPYITADMNGPKHFQKRLNRATFEELSCDLVERLKSPFQKALSDAKIKPSELNEIILVGGSTRMPMIQKITRELTGKEPNKGVNPDEVVSIGAAVQAGVLSGEVQDILLLDVTPLTLGIETIGGVMTPLIERNTTIPMSKSQVFSTADDNQTGVDVHVLQGERKMASNNMTLGKFRLDGLPPAPRGIPQIEVIYDIDANGILKVTARDKATGKEQQVTITASTNLSKREIKNFINEAKQHQVEDLHMQKLAEARNQAEMRLYDTEKLIAEEPKIPANSISQLDTQIKELRESLIGNDVEAIISKTIELQNMLEALVQHINPPPPPNGGNGHHPEEDTETEDDVLEGEFKEA